MIDLLDLVRSIAAAATRAAENKNYPSPCSHGSPLLASVRQACIERGYTADGLAVPGMREGALPPGVSTHKDVEKALLIALKSHRKAVETEHLHARSIGSGGPGELRKADFARRNTEDAIRALAALADAKGLMDKVIRVLEGYAENYDMMSRIGKTGDVDCKSVAHDIRRNMVDGVRAAIADKAVTP